MSLLHTLSDDTEKHEESSSAREPKQMTKYGELTIVGYNGFLPPGDRGRRRSKFVLYKRSSANGVKRSQHYVVKTPHSSQAILDVEQHSISYTLSKNEAVIVEYMPDEEKDMFQIGRSSESPIDFVVMDTIAGDKVGENKLLRSTVSRFACRILCDRSNPRVARIYGAGFDSSRNIFLGEKATKWQDSREIDGLTTNGVLILHPGGSFCGGEVKPSLWREVSVGGSLFSLRDPRSAQQKGVVLDDETNVLQDGTLIDLCGATLLWRSHEGLEKSPTKHHLETLVGELNAGRPQRPVGLNTLVIPRKLTPSDETGNERRPYLYLKCGHVQGHHDWGQDKGSKDRRCPACLKGADVVRLMKSKRLASLGHVARMEWRPMGRRMRGRPRKRWIDDVEEDVRTMGVGPVVKLCMGIEPAFYVDAGPPTFAFSPCGHMATEKTVKYWANVAIPHSTNSFDAVCPFCATPLVDYPGYVRLIFQDNVD